MAETFLFCLAEKVLVKLGYVTLQEIGLARGVKSDLKKLDNTLSTIKAVLLDAEEQQEKNHQLRIWLGNLKDVFYDAEDVLDEFEYEALRQQVVPQGSFITKVHSFFSHSNLKFRFKMGHKLKEIRKKLDEIAAEKANFHLKEQVEDRRVMHMGRETHSLVYAPDVIGRDEDKEHLVQLLMHLSDHEGVSVISIVGIGGIGKTTLAKLVYNDERVVGHFHLRMWVCVSDDFDVKIQAKEIIASATGTECGDLTMEQIQTRLQRILRDKFFLLILDDVWNEDRGKWVEFKNLLMVGANGSKILVTTRSPLVDSVIGSVHTYNLEGLPHKDCLSLFVKWAFKEGEEKRHPNLLKIGEEIVKKCGGVPLALKTLGSLLYSKTNVHEWLLIKDNEIWEIEQKENDILPALRLSYDAIPSHLKQCFALCSMFPKDFEFFENDLIQLWIANGLLQPSNDSQELEDIGQRYTKELRLRSFFEDVEDCPFLILKMHDLIHDLALSVSQTEYSTKYSNTHNISRSVRHVSFSAKDLSLDEVSRFILNLNSVRTIFFPVWGVRPTRKSFVEMCISRFKYLRVLDLRPSRLEVLPTSISSLKHLRYLDLSWNTIKKLPNSICKLQNLHTLKLEGCWELEELPRDIGNLISLRFLLLSTNQLILTEEGIGRLISLRFLGIGRCGNLKSLGEGMLQRLTALRQLTIYHCQSLESLPRNLKYLTKLEILEISNCRKLKLMEWEEDIQGLQLSLRLLFIRGLPELVVFPQWLQGAANTLQHLHIENCLNLRALPEWFQNLTLLQKLGIVGCPELSALPEGMHHLTALREFKIKWCSPELSRRCKRKTGEDWPKIAHVPNITLEGERIKSIDS